MKGLLLAGGSGTRLRPLTFTGNKHMIPIANQPILFYGLRNLALAGIREVGIVLGPLHEGIRERVGDGRDFGLAVEYIDQGNPRGLADAILCARQFLGKDPFLMYLGDNLLQSGVKPFLDTFAAQRPDAVVGVTPVTHPERYGVLETQGDRIVSIAEKPAHPRSNLALIGVYVFDNSVHEVVRGLSPSARGELEITDAIRQLWQQRGHVAVLHVDGWWKDTGAPEDLLEGNDLVLNSMPATSFVREGTVAEGAIVSGNVALGAGSVLEGGASVEGPVVVGAGVRIGSGTRVGPGTAVGDRVELRGCSVRRSILLEGARVLGSVKVESSLIGRNAQIEAVGPRDQEVSLIVGDASRVRL